MTQEIETGYETNNTRINTSDFEVEAYADDGEYATCWMVRRVSDELVEVETVRCESGLRETDGPIDVHDIDADTTVTEFARELANADPEEAVNLAREYWN